MIQRFQTLFLFASTAVFGFMLFSPLSEMVIRNTGEAVFTSMGITLKSSGEFIYTSTPLMILIAAIVLLSFVNIFLFKKRVLQMRICIYTILLMMGSIGLMLFYYFGFKNQFDIMAHSFKASVLLPLLAMGLTFQAFRGIRHDELLIKSYDRLR